MVFSPFWTAGRGKPYVVTARCLSRSVILTNSFPDPFPPAQQTTQISEYNSVGTMFSETKWTCARPPKRIPRPLFPDDLRNIIIPGVSIDQNIKYCWPGYFGEAISTTLSDYLFRACRRLCAWWDACMINDVWQLVLTIYQLVHGLRLYFLKYMYTYIVKIAYIDSSLSWVMHMS